MSHSDNQALKNKILNLTAKVGNRVIACRQLGLEYTDYRKICKEDPEFDRDVEGAEHFYKKSTNDAIKVMGKRKLLEILTNGVVETTMHTKTKAIVNKDGEHIDDYPETKETTIKKVYKGVPMSAIAAALDLTPDLVKATETFIDANLIPAHKQQLLEQLVEKSEAEQAQLIFGKQTETVELTDDMISGMQRTITGTVIK